MDELKKCPFCGGKAGIFYDFDAVTTVKVICHRCGASTREKVVRGRWLKDDFAPLVAHSKAAWNKRVREDD